MSFSRMISTAAKCSDVCVHGYNSGNSSSSKSRTAEVGWAVILSYLLCVVVLCDVQYSMFVTLQCGTLHELHANQTGGSRWLLHVHYTLGILLLLLDGANV
jgi:hypothetical protein